MERIIKKFKGGSLSSTNLVELSDGSMVVRKSVSLIENREYGFQRWYSQMKRLQRYANLFPGLFPKLLRYGKNDKTAYFDIEYYENAINAHEFVCNCISKDEIDDFFNTLMQSMNILYREKMISCIDAINLYINEEVNQRIKDCYKNNEFVMFLEYENIIFNGESVKSFIHVIKEYEQMCIDCFENPIESFTHGNITLENLLYIPNEKKIIMIDPYDENIIDSELAEFSQLLQSSNSKYEIYNNLDPIIDGNTITLDIEQNYGLNYFNDKLLHFIKDRYSFKQYILIRLLEVSQFLRMLPFKMEIEPKKMYFFYGLASYLFSNIKNEYQQGVNK